MDSKADFDALLSGIRQQKLLSAVLSAPRKKGEGNILKIAIRPLVIRGKFAYQLSEHTSTQVFHRNLDTAACSQFAGEAFCRFKQGVFTFTDSQCHVLVNRQEQMTIIKKKTEQEAGSLSHNKEKNHVLRDGVPVPFLIAVGIMSEEGKVFAKKYDKFRQINRFLEMVRDVVPHLPKGGPLEVVDFGCGKAYLTFALHHYLHAMEKREVRILGIDLKEEVISDCQQISKRLNCEGLSFIAGDINEVVIEGKVDLMISLHACDTATDAALEKAVRSDARIILCVPCCQHELYSQIQNPDLETLLRHGILKERMAALATDAARAELLTILGYEVQILEFIDMEHTPKNLLLRAVKGTSQEKIRQARERYHLFKNSLNIHPSFQKKTID